MHTRTAPSRSSELLGLAGLLMLALAWLLPNKIDPWISVTNEAVAATAFLLLAWMLVGRSRASCLSISWPLAILIAAGVGFAWLQWVFGLLVYAGDAWLITLYFGLFALALFTGRSIASGPEAERWQRALLLVLLTAGLVTAGLLLMQWLWTRPLTIYVQELRPNHRPYANLGQPNHANTLLFMALCCALQLRREAAIGRWGSWLASALLTLAMAVAQSRTGLVQLALLAGWSLWLARCTPDLRLRREWLWGALALAMAALWWWLHPIASEVFLLPQTMRDMGVATTTGDLRLAIWRAAAEATLLRPWTGWGWLQSGAAQEAISACHTDLRLHFNYTHLLPLDLLLWLGLPAGLLLIGLAARWLWLHLGSRGGAQGGYWIAALLGLLVHACLEYPYAYLYFLLPAGLIMGVIDARHPVHRSWRTARLAYAALCFSLTALAAVIAWDIGRASNTYTDIRFEDARIGLKRSTIAIPPMVLLDQLEDYLALGAANISKPVSEEVLASADQTARRFPYTFVLVRYAIMLKGAGKTIQAEQVQQLYCDIYGEKLCTQAANQWPEWQQKYPALTLGLFTGRRLPPRCQKSSF